MIEIAVSKSSVYVAKYIINKGEYKVNPCHFIFTSEYEGLIKKAVFVSGNTAIEQPILNNMCDIPYEVLNVDSFELRVFAYAVQDDDLLLRYSPTPQKLTLREGSYTGNTGSGEIITPTQFEQYEQALNDGLAEVANVDIEAEQTQDGATITITNRQGISETVDIMDGVNGQDGEYVVGIEYNWSGTINQLFIIVSFT